RSGSIEAGTDGVTADRGENGVRLARLRADTTAAAARRKGLDRRERRLQIGRQGPAAEAQSLSRPQLLGARQAVYVAGVRVRSDITRAEKRRRRREGRLADVHRQIQLASLRRPNLSAPDDQDVRDRDDDRRSFSQSAPGKSDSDSDPDQGSGQIDDVRDLT